MQFKFFSTIQNTLLSLCIILALSACANPKQALIETNADASGYSIALEFIGEDFSDNQKEIFRQAAARWSEIIVQDVPSVSVQSTQENVCGFGEASFSGSIDDLLIFAMIRDIDGKGKVLGAAFPSIVRDSDELTAVGCMVFDSSDLIALEDAGSLSNVILHEMGHVLGIGSFWQPILGFNSRQLLDYATGAPFQSCNSASSFKERPHFMGKMSKLEFAALGLDQDIPVEDDYGAGTQCTHWDESFFGSELMTGFSEANGDMPLSRLTIASLADLGYSVDFSKADNYQIDPCSLTNCFGSQAIEEDHEAWEIVLPPRAKVTVTGEVVPFGQ